MVKDVRKRIAKVVFTRVNHLNCECILKVLDEALDNKFLYNAQFRIDITIKNEYLIIQEDEGHIGLYFLNQ